MPCKLSTPMLFFLEQPVQALDHKVAKGRSICRDGRCVLKTIHQRMICVK